MSPKTGEKELAKQLGEEKETSNAAAIARLPELSGLNLTDDPGQIKDLIRAIDAQANKEITEFVTAVEDQRFVMVGHCFLRLKRVCEPGHFKEAVEELGKTYDEVHRQMKFTDTYIKQALTRKKDIDVILGPGMMGTMARLFNRGELRALGDGKAVHGLTDKALAGMNQREVAAHVRAAHAERDDAIVELHKVKKQQEKAHGTIKKHQRDLGELADKLRIVSQGPGDMPDLAVLAEGVFECTAKAATLMKSMLKLEHDENARELIVLAFKNGLGKLRIVWDEWEETASDDWVEEAVNPEKLLAKIGSAKDDA